MKITRRNSLNVSSCLTKLVFMILVFCLVCFLSGCGGQSNIDNSVNESSEKSVSANGQTSPNADTKDVTENPEANGEAYQDYSGATEAFHMDESSFWASIAKKAILDISYGSDITLGHMDMFLKGNEWIDNSTWTHDSESHSITWEFDATGEIFSDPNLELDFVAQGDSLRLSIRIDSDDDPLLSRIWKNGAELVGMDEFSFTKELCYIYESYGGVTTDGEEYWADWHEDKTAKRPYPEIRYVSDLISASFDEAVALLNEMYKYDSDEGLVFEHPYYEPNSRAYILEVYTDTTKQLVAIFYDYSSEENTSSSSEMNIDEIHISHNLFFLIPLQINSEINSRFAKEDIPCLITPVKIDYDGTTYYLKYDWYYIRFDFPTTSPSMTDYPIIYPEMVYIVRR